MSALGTELRKIYAWAAMGLVLVIPAISVADEQAVDLSLTNMGLIQDVCVGPYAIEAISGDFEKDEYYSARSLTFGEGWAQVNKALFGKKESAPSFEKVRYAYEPESIWAEWQKNYLEINEAGGFSDWGKVIAKENVGVPTEGNVDAPFAIIEFSGKNHWWQSKRYVGTQLPIVGAGAAQTELDLASNEVLNDPALQVIQSKLATSLEHEVVGEKLLRLREAFCTLSSLFHNKGWVGLSKAYAEIEPYKVFILSKEAGTNKDK